MSLLYMSFPGALFIIAVVVVRAALINRIPKKTFLVLWEILSSRSVWFAIWCIGMIVLAVFFGCVK